ncbi:MAG: acyltransferase family protein [Mucilaginibacter sp.]
MTGITNSQELKKRLLSLEVFRGLTIAAMILVNDPGDWGHIYAPLEHSKWNGCTPTDLIFPFFLFMVGVSIVYAMESKKEVAADHTKLILRALRRMVIILIIQYSIQLLFHPGLAHMRIPGVLPRIAVVYFICTVLYVKTSQKTRDWLFVIALVGYYIIMNFIPVPGVGYANLEPTTNMGAYIDRLVFTTNHLWAESHTWDPEGLLGTIPAIATGLFGIRLGSWLKRKDREDSVKVSWMFTYGAASVILALLWDLFFPINKALWTSSFVLYAGGLATIGLALSYWLIDVQGYKKFTPPLVAFGANAITAYILADFIPHYLGMIKGNVKGDPFYHAFFTTYFSPVNASLASAIFIVLVIWVVMWILYLRKIIIKV